MRRTKHDADQTRSDILAAAEALFLERGVSNTSLEHIARHAGVTRGAVYWHFKNKADLFHALLNQVRLPSELIVERIKQCDPQNPLVGLRNICVHSLAALLQDERKRRIFTILLRRCEFTDDLKEAELKHESFINEIVQMNTDIFAMPEIASQLRPGVTPGMASRAMHFMFIGILGEWLRDPQIIDLERTEIYFDALMSGLVKDWQSVNKACPQAAISEFPAPR